MLKIPKVTKTEREKMKIKLSLLTVMNMVMFGSKLKLEPKYRGDYDKIKRSLLNGKWRVC